MDPDALAKMVEDKARALLAADRAQAVADEKAEQQRKELAETRYTLERSREKYEQNDNAKRRPWFLDKRVFTLIAVASVLLGALMMPGCVEPIIGRSLVAGSLLCGSTCKTCRGPGRVFTWHESGGSYEGNVSSQLCHNADVDIDRMTWQDVDNEDDKALLPYRLSLWSSVLLDAPLVFVVLFLFFPFAAARVRNKYLARERIELEEKISDCERRLAAADPPKVAAGAYRT